MAEDLELVEGLIEDFSKYKTKSEKQIQAVVKEVSDKLDTATADVKAENLKWKGELDAQVKTINDEYAALGITVKQAQEELNEFKAKKGRAGGMVEDQEQTFNILKQAFADEFEKIKMQAHEPDAKFKMHLKAVGTMTAAAHLTGAVQASYYSGGVVARPKVKTHFRDLVQVIPSATGLWKFYRANIPTGEGSFDWQLTHGALKAQVDYDLTEVTLNAEYLAGWVKIAKQMLQDLPFLQNYVNSQLIEDYLRKEDNAFFGQLYSAATGASTGSSTNTAEKVIDIMAAVEEANHDVNAIVVTGAVWAGILKTTLGSGAGYGVPGGITISPNGDVQMLGIPLIKTSASNIGNNRILMGDFTKVKIIQAEGLNVSMSEHDQDNFVRNVVTVKCEARVGLAILDPTAFSYATAI